MNDLNIDKVANYGEIAVEMGVKYIPRIAGALILLFAAWVVAGWLGYIVRRSLNKASVDLTLTRFFSKLVRWAVLIMAGLACLGVFGVETTSFAAVIGAAGLAVGLAFQGTLSNFSAGVMLLFFRPFKVGDFIKVSGSEGTVHEIELFTTSLDTIDNKRIILPNSQVFGNTITNFSYHDVRRCDVDVGTEYKADLNAAREALEKVARELNSVPDREPQVVLLSLGDSSINWQVRVWTQTSEFWPTWQKTVQQVKEALDSAGIGIPFPQRDVHMIQS